MTTPKLSPILMLAFALVLGCDKGEDKKTDDKSADKKADDEKADDEKAAEKPAEPEAPKGPVFKGKDVLGEDAEIPLVAFDLAAVELPGFTIQVPEETKAMSKSPSGYTLFNSMINFSITVDAREFNKDEAVKVFGIVDPEGKVVDESDTHVIYQRSGEGGHLFQAGTKVGDKSFTCGTVASISPFTRENIDQSVAACRSIAAAEGGAAPAPAPAP